MAGIDVAADMNACSIAILIYAIALLVEIPDATT